MVVMTPYSRRLLTTMLEQVVNNEAWPQRTTTLHISPPNGHYRTGYVGGTILSMHHYAPLESSC